MIERTNDVEFQIRAARGDMCAGPDSIKLYAFELRGNETLVAQKLELKQQTKSERYVVMDPFLEIHKQVAQKFMDDLWDCGLRPSEGTGSAGAMRAVEKHLADMKIIAFHALKIQEEKK